MNDQQRIETAADNCEVLRARLAKYEDSEGNAIAWKVSGADYDSNIHNNPDAKAWADFFVSVFPAQADKHELMLGWFANAMMAMHDHLKAQPVFQDERAAFEGAYAHARSLPVALIQQLRRGDDYAETEGARLGIAWNVWQQARAALSAGSQKEQK